MSEKEIKLEFINQLKKFKETIKRPNVRLYAYELPCRIELHKKEKYADVVLINEDTSKTFYEMQMFVIEFKKDKIEYGPIDQLNMYVNYVHKKFYRKNPTIGILVAPQFSNHEIQQCKKYGYHALQLDNQFNMRFIV